MTIAITSAGLVALPSAAGALEPQQLFVSASHGSDTNPCSAVAPCATVQHAVDIAGTTPSAIGIAGGAYGTTYSGPVDIAAGQQITLAPSDGDGPITLSAPGDEPVVTNDGILAVTNVAFNGGTAGIEQDSGELSLHSVDALTPSDGVRVEGGSVTETSPLTDSDGGSIPFDLDSGSLVISNVSPLGVITQTGGRLVIDASMIGDASLAISGGSALIEDSEFDPGSAQPAVSVSGAGDATIEHSSFLGDQSPAVDGRDAVLTLLASSFLQAQSPVTATNGGVLRMAASALDVGDGPECQGPVVDGGYNSASDGSCAFSEPSSRNSAPRNQMQPSYNPEQAGPPSIDVPDNLVKITSAAGLVQTNTLVDAIPFTAVASFDPNIRLCDPATTVDEVGQRAPVDLRCDIGSVELQPSRVTVFASSAKSTPGKPVTLTAKVTASASNLLLLDGLVTFTSAGRPIRGCTRVEIRNETTVSCLVRPELGTRRYAADFVPLRDLHTATSSVVTVRVERAKVGVTLSVPSARQGERSHVTGHVEDAATHRPADVLARVWARTAATKWHPIGPAAKTGSTGSFRASITVMRRERFELRTERTADFEAGTSKVVHPSVPK